jgi:hypothetical protein
MPFSVSLKEASVDVLHTDLGVAGAPPRAKRAGPGDDVPMTVEPPDIKARLSDADGIVDQLPWQLGDTEAQRKRSRGRVSALAHQVAGLLANGWTLDEVRDALGGADGADTAPDAGAQEKRWRAALKRETTARRLRRAAGAQASVE